jgi:hypothetical protein
MMGIEFKRPPHDPDEPKGPWRPSLETWIAFALIAAIVAFLTLKIPSLSHAASLAHLVGR